MASYLPVSGAVATGANFTLAAGASATIVIIGATANANVSGCVAALNWVDSNGNAQPIEYITGGKPRVLEAAGDYSITRQQGVCGIDKT